MAHSDPAAGWTPEERVMCAGGLPFAGPGSDEALAAALRGPVDWDRLVARAHREGLASILLKRTEGIENRELRIQNAEDGTIRSHSEFAVLHSQFPSVPPDVLARLRGIRHATLAKNLRLGRRLEDVDAALFRRGIRGVLLKGGALVRAGYGDPGLRGMGDLDLLVPPADVPGADEALREAGFAPASPLPEGIPERGVYLNSVVYGVSAVGPSSPVPRPPSPSGRWDEGRGTRDEGKDDGSGVGAESGGEDPWGPVFVHLHWHWLNASFPMLPYGEGLDGGLLHAGARPLAGLRAIAGPAPEAGVLHLCEHAFKHAYDFLIRIVDVAAHWRAAGPDAGRVAELARRCRLERPVGMTLRLAESFFGWRDAAPAAEALEGAGPVARAERVLYNNALGHRRGGAGSYWAYLAWQEGMRGKLSFVAQTLFPPPEDLRRIEEMDRRPGAADYAARAVRGVRYLMGAR